MRAARVCLGIAIALSCAAGAFAQAHVAVNGALPPAATTVTVGSIAAVSVSGGPGNTTDWVGLYAVGSPDSAYFDWRYLNGGTAVPARTP
jgi:hypothetical protein